MDFIIKCDFNGSGVYKIKNDKNNFVYVGRSKHLKSRAEEHRRNFEKSRCNRKLRKFIKENPDAVFTFEVLARLPNIEEAEEKYIKRFDSVRFGFNLVYNDFEIKKRFNLSIAKNKKEKPKKEPKPKPKKASLKWLQSTKAFKATQRTICKK